MTKTCPTCRGLKADDEFPLKRDGTRAATCESCRGRRAAWYRENAELEKLKVKAWQAVNPAKVREYDKTKAARAEQRNPGYASRKHKAWRDANKEHVRASAREVARRRRAECPLRGVRAAMISRCHNLDDPGVKNYGGRGIRVCEEWRGSLERFIADVGTKPGPGYSLDRIDNDGDYEPGNVRWATREEQARNTRRNVLLTHDGRTQCVSAWAKELGIPVMRIHGRLADGWSPDDALSKPKRENPVLIERAGKTQNLTEWCRELGLSYSLIAQRIRRGWSPERALA